MCGIVAVLRRSSGRMPPDGPHLLAELEQAVAALAVAGTVGGADQEIAGPDVLTPVAERVEAVDALLHGAPGVRALLADRELADDGVGRQLQPVLAADLGKSRGRPHAIEPPAPPATADHQILQHAVARHEVEMLMHHPDAEPERVGR